MTFRKLSAPIFLTSLILTSAYSSANAAVVEARCSSSPLVVNTDTKFTQCTTTRTLTFGATELTSSSFASANLATGQLKSRSLGQYAAPYANGSSSNARMSDTITIEGEWVGEIIIQLNMHSDGQFINQGANQANLSLTDTGPSSASLQNQAQLDISWDGISNTVTTSTANSQGDYDVSVISPIPSNFESLISLNFIVTPDNPSFSFRALLQTANLGGTGTTGTSITDFSNTAGLELILPDDLTFTSESGVFLSAVPVPAAAWLFISGLLGLIGGARRKNR